MKTFTTLIATAFVASAFAGEPAKAPTVSPTEKAVQAREDSRDKAMAKVAGVKEVARTADTKSAPAATAKAEAPKK